MTDARRHRSHRPAPRPIGRAVSDLLATLRARDDEHIDVTLSPRVANAIALMHARRTGVFRDRFEHPALLALITRSVDRATLEGWAELAWQAASKGVLAPSEAQALSDLLEPRDAA